MQERSTLAGPPFSNALEYINGKPMVKTNATNKTTPASRLLTQKASVRQKADEPARIYVKKGEQVVWLDQ
eukprot:12585988-Prorocentrum_lima.AAC.1